MSGRKRSIAIIGTGALACIFAVRLDRFASVHMVGSWQSQIDSINRQGITVANLDGTITTARVDASAFPHLSGRVTADFVIVLVKSYQTQEAVERIKAIAGNGTTVVTLQNGLGNLETLSNALPDLDVSAGITMQGANITGLSHVVHAGNGATIIDDVPKLYELADLLNTAGIPTDMPSGAIRSIDAVLWRKLVINTAVNPITALTGQCNGFLADNDIARQLSEATARETMQVAVAEGVWENPAAIDAGSLVTDAARVTAANRSSMLQDISRGSRTEIEAMCGEVVTRATKCGCAAPMNQLWLRLVTEAEKTPGGTEGKIVYNIDELAALAGFDG